jgi:hypothetical protein
MEPVAWGGITGPPVTGGHKYRDLVFQVGVGRKPDGIAKINVAKPKEVKQGSNLAESSKEGYG